MIYIYYMSHKSTNKALSVDLNFGAYLLPAASLLIGRNYWSELAFSIPRIEYYTCGTLPVQIHTHIDTPSV